MRLLFAIVMVVLALLLGCAPTTLHPLDLAQRAPGDPAQGSLAYLDFQHGFRDLAFYDPPTPDMVLMDETGDLKRYVRPHEELRLGDATARRIDYFFYKGRLATVHLATTGFVNSQQILDLLRQAYGLGEPSTRVRHRYVWYGARVKVSYDRHPSPEEADVWFHSIPLVNEERADQHGHTRPGVSDGSLQEPPP
jgi:hypothetical protein